MLDVGVVSIISPLAETGLNECITGKGQCLVAVIANCIFPAPTVAQADGPSQ